MRHYDDDTLLKFALDALPDDADAAEIEDHLADCDECRARLETIRGDVDIIAGIQPTIEPLASPRPSARPALWVRMLRVAAVFACGIAVGFGTSSGTREESVCISPAYRARPAASVSARGLALADATAVSSSESR